MAARARIVKSKTRSHGWEVWAGDSLITTTFGRDAAEREAAEYNANKEGAEDFDRFMTACRRMGWSPTVL